MHRHTHAHTQIVAGAAGAVGELYQPTVLPLIASQPVKEGGRQAGSRQGAGREAGTEPGGQAGIRPVAGNKTKKEGRRNEKEGAT